MRARHPELFSDSVLIEESKLTRELLEYELETLTNRKQEADFENFCRQLAEKEICPNLRPQTGPTGGGDSKTDTENYPIADEFSFRWYEGIGREISQERWAFAFSAKRAWRDKAQSDVKKIVETVRNYKLIYFITNQFIRDKERAKAEEEFSERLGVRVCIFDRNWIISKVFDHGRLELAIDTLHLTKLGLSSQKVVGPLDIEREQELKQLEKQIEDTERYQGVEYQLAEDCLRAAILARGLGNSRHDIDGRFARAKRIANRVGRRQQLLRIVYNQAWTAFWWYEDFDEFVELYGKAQQFAIDSFQAPDLELLVNLWCLLNASIRSGRINAATALLQSRTATLREALEKLADDTERPTNALWARTNRLFMDFQESLANDDACMEPALQEFQEILSAAEGMIAYPLDTVAKLIQEMGIVLTDSPQYDALFENVVTITQRRVSESEAGRLLLERGLQQLRKGRMYDTIRLCGRAQQKLALLECREELVQALMGCGLAYESAGLLWAARANVLAAANQVFSYFTEHGQILPQAIRCIHRLVWLELRLGRIPYVLQWIETASVIAQHLGISGKQRDRFLEERRDQDFILGLLILKTKFAELQQLAFLPGLFELLGLQHSWMALLYALGYEDLLSSEEAIPKDVTREEVLRFFADWASQPAAIDLPEHPEFINQPKITLRSKVLGCEIVTHLENNFASICFAERILASLEALLATSLELGVFPHTPNLNIRIRVSSDVKGNPQVHFDDGVAKTVTILHSPREEDLRGSDQSWLQELVGSIIPRIIMLKDVESF
jgi:hypothetical protein